MIEISNLRKRTLGDMTRLEVEINFIGMTSPYSEKTLYYEIDKKYNHMFADDSYDAFVLVPLWLAMYHKQNLHIRGKISKKLFQNIKWYIQKIWCDYWDVFSPVNLIVDGFTSPLKERGKIVGAGISCGVDSLSTIYDHFIREDDPDYKINALFYFDCGIFGTFGDEMSKDITLTRSIPGRNVATELGLPYYYLKSNLHAFRKQDDLVRFNYIAVYSCALSLSNDVGRYYVSNTTNYEEIKKFRDSFHNDDMAEFCESYLVPLIQNERVDLIIDGCQYRRVDKLRNIVDWDITKKYLNVCWRYTPDGSNCTLCPKCLRTLLPLEIMGKLDDYKNVFDLEKYQAISFNYKIDCIKNYNVNVFDTENVDFAKENNFALPKRHECYTLGKQVAIVKNDDDIAEELS